AAGLPLRCADVAGQSRVKQVAERKTAEKTLKRDSARPNQLAELLETARMQLGNDWNHYGSIPGGLTQWSGYCNSRVLWSLRRPQGASGPCGAFPGCSRLASDGSETLRSLRLSSASSGSATPGN